MPQESLSQLFGAPELLFSTEGLAIKFTGVSAAARDEIIPVVPKATESIRPRDKTRLNMKRLDIN